MLSVKIEIILFIIVFFGTLYYIKSKSFEEKNIGLIITSFVQGLVLSVMFPKYLLLAPILAILYYVIFYNIWSLKFLLKSPKLEPYNDKALIESLKEIPEISHIKFNLRKYSGEKSLNANVIPPIPLLSSEYKISFGEDLISKFTLEEKMIVLAHEVGHALNKHILKKVIMQFILIFVLGFTSFGMNLIVLNCFKSCFIYYNSTATFILLLVGIIGINTISWYVEYDADKMAIQLTNDIKNFESAFLKFDEDYHYKNYGKILNLLVYSHPLLHNRIKRIKEISNTFDE